MSSLPKCVTIFVNGSCNMSCIYCYSAKAHSPASIEMEFAKRGMEDFLGANRSKELRLFGVGEATIAFDRMVEIVDFARFQAGPGLKVELQSNGYFSSTVADWIEANIDILWLSSDGPPEIHGAYRRTSRGEATSSVVHANIQRFAASGSCKLGVRATITSETTSRQTEIVAFFNSLGVRNLCADPIFVPVDYQPNEDGFPKHLLLHDAETYGKDFLEAHRLASLLGMSYSSILTANAGTRNEYGCRGCFTNPHLTVDGAVTCCDMAFTKRTPLRQMVWGEYNSLSGRIVYDKKAIGCALSRSSQNIPACSKCRWKKQCSGGCFGEALNETGDLFAVKDFSCRAVRYILPRLNSRTRFPTLGHP